MAEEAGRSRSRESDTLVPLPPGSESAVVLAELRSLSIAQRRLEASLAALRREQREDLSKLSSQLLAKAESTTPPEHPPSSEALAPAAPQPVASEIGVASGPVSALAWRTATPNQAAPDARKQVTFGRLSSLLDSASCAGLRAEGTSNFASGAPHAWPASVRLREPLEREEEEDAQAGNIGLGSLTLGASFLSASEAQVQDIRSTISTALGISSCASLACGHGFWRRRCRWLAGMVLDPHTPLVTLHEVMCILAIVYDLAVVPYMLAWHWTFDTPLHGPVSWCVLAYWCFDLCLRFKIGYYRDDGCLERNLGAVARHHLRTWFLPGLAPLLADLARNLHPLVSVQAALNFFDLVRVPRIWGLFSDLSEWCLSEHWRMACQGSKLFVALLWANHLFTCSWVALGVYGPSDTGGRWFDTVEASGSPPFAEWGIYSYFTAFHWSLGQITAAGVEGISPLNTVERLFSIFCLVFGLLIVSSLVSSLSSTMTQLKLMNQEQTTRMRTLRVFLSQNDVRPRVAMRVQRQASERMARRERLRDKDVPALSFLSSALRDELSYEILGPHLLRHPLVRVCAVIDEGTVHHVCGKAVDRISMGRGDVIFEAGVEAKKVFYLIHGELLYKQSPRYSPVEEVITHVSKDSWISEAALWTRWKHVGKASCAGAECCELLALDAAAMLEGLMRHAVVKEVVAKYGRLFHAQLVAAGPPHSEYPSDLEVPFTDYGDLVLSMDQETQALIGQATLHVLKKRKDHRSSQRRIQMLEDEVAAGRCAVHMDGAGQVVRAVAISVVRLLRPDGRLLVHLGRCEDGTIIPLCRLPGGKIGPGDTAREVAERTLDELAPLVGRGDFLHTEHEVDWRESPTFGTRTRYLRTVETVCAEGMGSAESLEVSTQRFWKWRSTSTVSRILAPAGSDRKVRFDTDAFSIATAIAQYPVYVLEKELPPQAAKGPPKLRLDLYTWLLQREMDELAGSPRLVQHWINALDLLGGEVRKDASTSTSASPAPPVIDFSL